MTQKTKRAVPKPVTPRPVPPLKGNGKTPPTESVEVLGRLRGRNPQIKGVRLRLGNAVSLSRRRAQKPGAPVVITPNACVTGG
jgi:hypothetical protein